MVTVVVEVSVVIEVAVVVKVAVATVVVATVVVEVATVVVEVAVASPVLLPSLAVLSRSAHASTFTFILTCARIIPVTFYVERLPSTCETIRKCTRIGTF